MTKKKIEQARDSNDDYSESRRQEQKMAFITEKAEFNLFSMLKPALKKEKNGWRVSYEEDSRAIIVGFGDSPYEAILDWNKKWYKKSEARKKE